MLCLLFFGYPRACTWISDRYDLAQFLIQKKQKTTWFSDPKILELENKVGTLLT